MWEPDVEKETPSASRGRGRRALVLGLSAVGVVVWAAGIWEFVSLYTGEDWSVDLANCFCLAHPPIHDPAGIGVLLVPFILAAVASVGFGIVALVAKYGAEADCRREFAVAAVPASMLVGWAGVCLVGDPPLDPRGRQMLQMGLLAGGLLTHVLGMGTLLHRIWSEGAGG